MSFNHLFRTLAFLACALFPLGTLAQEPRAVSILVKGESEFEVMHYRVLSNATGAVIAGLIGAGIQASVEADKDEKLRQEFEPKVHSEHWKDYFLDVLNERLSTKEIIAHWAEDGEAAQADLVLQLDPDRHGFRIVDSNTLLMAAFVEFEYRIYPASLSRRDIPDYQQAYVTNKTSRPREVLAEDEVILNQDLNDALSKAARRMANKIIYWKP